MSHIYADGTPFLSVIIPCYKQAELLPEALDSLLNQEYSFWEAIVVNDGSPDHTTQVAETYSAKDPRIRLLIKENGGLSSARNAGMRVAKGKWLLFLDADDTVLKGCFSALFKKANQLPVSTLVQYGYQYISENGARIFHKTYPPIVESLLPSILSYNIGPCHSVIIQKEFADEVGVFDETLKSAEDWDFWIRAAKCGAKVEIIQEVLVNYRIQESSMSRQPVVMFDALETVLLRGVKNDPRLPDSISTNRQYTEIDLRPSVKHFLTMFIGVALVQNQKEVAIQLYSQNTNKYHLEWQPEDWRPMCSYLSFRYRYLSDEVLKALNVYRNIFREFLTQIGYDKKKTDNVLQEIFETHIKIYNRQKWGIAGKVFNYLRFQL